MIQPGFWKNKRVLLTGHTGFKGAWMALLLEELGADVLGIALPPEGEPNLYTLLAPWTNQNHQHTDITNCDALRRHIPGFSPDIVIHMAAQSLVRRSYLEPLKTYETNLIGTLNMLSILRDSAEPAVTLVITTDKVYDNRDTGKAFLEDDVLGGDDPYSASKACTEIAVRSWQKSFGRSSNSVLATARAGNVIGGGDWAEDRLIPDYIRAVASNSPFILRNPHAIRPWQHVLDVLFGYLCYIEYLAGTRDAAHVMNFGPSSEALLTTEAVVQKLQATLGVELPVQLTEEKGPAEKSFLALNADEANKLLGWHTLLNHEEAIAWTADWYRSWLNNEEMRTVSLRQIERYRDLA